MRTVLDFTAVEKPDFTLDAVQFPVGRNHVVVLDEGFIYICEVNTRVWLRAR
jgi:hypothetical protein